MMIMMVQLSFFFFFLPKSKSKQRHYKHQKGETALNYTQKLLIQMIWRSDYAEKIQKSKADSSSSDGKPTDASIRAGFRSTQLNFWFQWGAGVLVWAQHVRKLCLRKRPMQQVTHLPACVWRLWETFYLGNQVKTKYHTSSFLSVVIETWPFASAAFGPEREQKCMKVDCTSCKMIASCVLTGTGAQLWSKSDVNDHDYNLTCFFLFF